MSRVLFRWALAGLGLGLRLACRWSARFRAQVAHERTVEIGSADGVARRYEFSPRGVTSRPGRADHPDVGVCFDNARLGLVTLVSPHAVGRIVRALLDRSAQYEGNAVLVLWFFGLTRFVLPLGRMAPLRTPLPDAYLEHDAHSRVAARIVREPAADELDPNWLAAHPQRARMVMIRGSAGEAVRLW
jgi:hypothetical protein